MLAKHTVLLIAFVSQTRLFVGLLIAAGLGWVIWRKERLCTSPPSKAINSFRALVLNGGY